MKSLKPFIFYSLTAVTICCIYSCKKEKAASPVDVIYSVDVDGLTVTFTNQTKSGTTYKWDFGDGATSTEENPVHTYPSKGKFVPTLYVGTAGGATFEGSTVLHISKGSPVKLNDHSFADWDTLNNSVITSGAGGGIFRQVKFDYNGENIFFYIEMSSKKSNGDIFDFYIDPDNNSSTGLLTGLFKNGGFDVLIEGAMLNNWFDLFYHTGEQNSFTFNLQSVSDFYQVGTITEDNGILRFEGRLSRSKIQGLTGKGFKIGIAATKSDWSATLGTAPDANTAAFFVDTSD
jgi:PKD repeat protein